MRNSKQQIDNFNKTKKNIIEIINANLNLSQTEIATLLNNSNIRTIRGMKWTNGSVSDFMIIHMGINSKQANFPSVEYKKAIDKIIIDNKDRKLEFIAGVLNKHNLKTVKHKKWTIASVCKYKNQKLNLKLNDSNSILEPDLDTLRFNKNISSQLDKIEPKVIPELEPEKEILPNYEIKDLVFEQDGKFCTDSLKVASIFGDSHDQVLRTIRELKCSKEFSLYNFVESNYINERGRTYPKIIITRDGFSMVAFGYKTEEAIKFREAYINQFNKMEAFIKSKLEPTPIIPVQNNQMDLLRQMFLGIDETNKIVLETKEQSTRAEQMAETAINKIIDMETKNNKAKEELAKEVEYSDRLLPDMKVRYKCQNVINNYVANKFLNASKADFSSLWSLVDKEFYDRFRHNLGIRKSNEVKSTGKKVTRYDIAEDLGLIEELYDVISFLFKIEK